MKFAILDKGKVVNIVVADAEFAATNNWIDATGAEIGSYWNGQSFLIAVPTLHEIRSEIVAATQARLDAFARERNYDDIKSACTYAGCSVPKFNTEGSYCQDRRAETWAKLYDMLAEVQAGTRPMPNSFADVEPELPALVWPI